ncbi:MAG TPA: phosphoadenylyl-sulfate reductase [Stellaceae bacterium]|nr:phosphoadenylyl-sulfate reductase [Stellaceae bacterium]
MTLHEPDDTASLHPVPLPAVNECQEQEVSEAAGLAARFAGLDGSELLRVLITGEFFGRVAVVSSFGAESAAILAMVSEIDRRTPVLFLDTGKLFGETLRYRDRLVDRLGLSDVRTISPDKEKLSAGDPNGMLWLGDPDACCALRKVEPLHRALAGFAAWISGRKRYHGGARAALPVLETDPHGRVKINPLAGWSRAQVVEELLRRDLPRHPLEAQGYLSIGCYTCTDRVGPGEDLRAGRWRGLSKTECGIHAPAPPGKR